MDVGGGNWWDKLDPASYVYSPVVSFCEHSDEPSGYIKKAGYLLTSSVTINFSKNILYHIVKYLVNH
jgi:hypothetical protein